MGIVSFLFRGVSKGPELVLRKRQAEAHFGSSAPVSGVHTSDGKVVRAPNSLLPVLQSEWWISDSRSPGARASLVSPQTERENAKGSSNLGAAPLSQASCLAKYLGIDTLALLRLGWAIMWWEVT